MLIQQSINRIRAFQSSKGWSKTRLATEAGIVDTVLRNFENSNWNPTTKTLRKLESIIPLSFQCEKA